MKVILLIEKNQVLLEKDKKLVKQSIEASNQMMKIKELENKLGNEGS